jgi:hypothetical protein
LHGERTGETAHCDLSIGGEDFGARAFGNAQHQVHACGRGATRSAHEADAEQALRSLNDDGRTCRSFASDPRHDGDVLLAPDLNAHAAPTILYAKLALQRQVCAHAVVQASVRDNLTAL